MYKVMNQSTDIFDELKHMDEKLRTRQPIGQRRRADGRRKILFVYSSTRTIYYIPLNTWCFTSGSRTRRQCSSWIITMQSVSSELFYRPSTTERLTPNKLSGWINTNHGQMSSTSPGWSFQWNMTRLRYLVSWIRFIMFIQSTYLLGRLTRSTT